MAPFRLLVLGPPRLERDSRPVELNLRRALALLVYLAVGAGPTAGRPWPPCSGPTATNPRPAAACAAPSTA